MLRICLLVLCGAYLLQLLPRLPSAIMVGALLACAVACCIYRRSRPLAILLFGFCFMWHAANVRLADRLDSSQQNESMTITAGIVDFPIRDDHSIRLTVAPFQKHSLPKLVRLRWYEPDAFPEMGEVWQFQVRLRRPHGQLNRHGFDYEGWLYREGIGATGYVIADKLNRRQNGYSLSFWTALRQRIDRQIDASVQAGESRAILKAVAIGARHEIRPAQWQRFARTGTSHLMAISGLHIGLAASAAFLITWLTLAPFVKRLNIRDMAVVVSLAVAIVYAQIAGLAVPALRAVLMAAVVAVCYFSRRRVMSWHMLASVCLLVFLRDPITILAPGFIMSFVAVAVIIWTAGPLSRKSPEAAMGWTNKAVSASRLLLRLQIALFFGLLPLSVALFGRIGWLAPLANLIVLPIFNVVTVPSALLGSALVGPMAPLGSWLLSVADKSIQLVLAILGVADRIPAASLEPPLFGWLVMLIAGPTIVFVVAPLGWPGRGLAYLSLLAALFFKPVPTPKGCVDLQILDVGQGLAVIARTHGHNLVYDTGPAFRSGVNSAERVVGPALKAQGDAELDMLIISHADTDHAGGYPWLRENWHIGSVIAGEPEHAQSIACAAGQSWQWDGVEFLIVHPNAPITWHGNDASCVLRITIGHYNLLILGDIERRAEEQLVARNVLRKADLVVVPHHGSRTSSSLALVNRLQPNWAVVSTGFGNRWGFPKSAVVNRWVGAGARFLNTATDGAIAFRYCADQPPSTPRLERVDSKRYWHDP